CSLVSSLSSPIWKNDTVSVSVLTATSLRPSAVISIGLDLSARVGWHWQAPLQISPAWQPVALPSHASPLPVSMTPSPPTPVAAHRGRGLEVRGRLPLCPERSRQHGAVVGDERLPPALCVHAGALALRENDHDRRPLFLPAQPRVARLTERADRDVPVLEND